ncbi:alpha/beta fold hydrolase [Kribbella yunnanensis]|uniref:Alpha/beta fold hydrolase n=1 Tax=Kribbella yunnanensis TaxID=190194 RepID=A0ABN2JAA1_9ACTN
MQRIRPPFALLERVAPALGAALLYRTWFQVRDVPEKVRAPRAGLPEATPFQVGAVRGRAYGEGPLVYLVHGWAGWGLQLGAYVAPLVEQGFRVITYDAPSHGDADPGELGPGRSTMLEAAEALQAVVAEHGPAHGLIAHSGGAVATALALRAGLKVERMVFVAAATDFSETLDQFAALLGFGPRIRAGFLSRFKRDFGPLEDFALPKVIAGLDLPPLLLIHDRADPETSYQGSVALLDQWPGSRLETSDGLGHRRVLRDAALVQQAVDFLAERAPGDGPAVVRETMGE